MANVVCPNFIHTTYIHMECTF